MTDRVQSPAAIPSALRVRCAALIAALMVAMVALLPLPARANNVVGAWLSPSADNWPLIPIHMALTPDGRVLSYGTDGAGTQTGYFIYDVWDPSQGLSNGHLTLQNLTLTDIFCSSQVIMPQSGSILINGGDNWTGTQTTNTGNNNTNVFKYTDNTLSRGPNLNRSRWYSSSTVLMNGAVYIQAGTSGSDRPEVRDTSGTLRLLSNVDTSALDPRFPRNFLAPDGRIFGYDVNGVMYYVDTNGSGQITMAGQILSQYVGWTSSAAMYRPGKILQFGGNSNQSAIIDLNGPQPVVTPSANMSSTRKWVSGTVLADGRVLATGGSSAENQLTGVNTSAEVWNPATGTWLVGPNGSRARLYHSGALLLPDGSVLVAGGGAPGPLTNLHGEIYYPSYLYNSSGGFATRPTISSAPDSVNVGDNFSIGVGTATIQRVTLVKSGSVTHSVNMDQRFIDLSFTGSTGTLFVQLPSSAAVVTPGYYLMFAFNTAGVPSVAKILRVNIAASPTTQIDYMSTVGGSGGSPFTIACNSNETLAGVYGNSGGTLVDRVGLQCIQIDQYGHWIGNPVNRGTAGSVNGAAYTKTCPRDQVISAFRGRASTSVNQLDFECKALTTAGTLTGAGTYLGPVGGTGGTAVGPYNCTTGNPAYAMTGRADTSIQAFSMSCRAAPITQIAVNSPPVVTNPGNQTSTVGTPVSLQIQASDPEGGTLSYSAGGLPAGLSISSTSGLISGTPTTVQTTATSVSVSDGNSSTTVNFTWTIGSQSPLTLDPMPDQPARLVNTSITYTASSSNGVNTQYKWYFDDGTESGWSTSPSVTHTYTQPTIYWIAVTAKDDRGYELTQTFSQLIYRQQTTQAPSSSGNLALSGTRLWIVNQDNDSVSLFDTGSNTKLGEITVGKSPRAVAVAANGQAWVTNRYGDSISVVDPTTLSVARTITLPFGSQPFGIVFAPGGGAVYVALAGTGQVVRIDPVSGSVLVTLNVGRDPRHLSVNSDGTRLLVSRFITPPLPGENTATITTTTSVGGEVLVVDTGAMTILSTIKLRHSDDLDFENSGAGIPNYLGPAVISPDGTMAWVPSKKDNIKRGTLRSGANLNFQNTVRAISSRIDLATMAEDYGSRMDHDNASVASAAAFDKYGVFMFVALETSREVAVIDVNNHAEFYRINVGRAPQGLAVSADGYKLYVSNFMDRTVGVYDLTKLIDEGQWQTPLVATLSSVATERLSATVLNGKRLFYDARDTRLARDAYMSCATCHNDGGGDGRVWDLTGLGEGLRSTISLRGHGGGQGFLHWTANFDEVQDFEGQIRTLASGTGLMTDTQFNTGTRSQPLGDPKAGISADLDALAAYVTSLNTFAKSPYRNSDGTLTADGVAGKAVFLASNCQQCHGGTEFTDSGAAILHDVGTIKQPTSGTRLGQTLTGLDTPTLRDVWATAPYLHDGSAATLEDAVRAHTNVSVSDTDLPKLTAYLRQIDGIEPSATGSPLRGQDIGAVAAAGSSSENGGVYSVTGSGADIWGTADEFQFMSQALTGDGAIIARMTGWTNPQRWSKAGVMIREQLTANSRYAFMLLAVYDGTGSAALQYRTPQGATAAQLGSNDGAGLAPYWLKLVRQGDSITGYISANGTTWKSKGTVTLSSLASTVQIGLAVTSHKDGTLTTAQFDNVSITGATPTNTAPVVNAGGNVSGTAGQSVALNGSATDDGLPVPPGALTVSWSTLSGPGTPTFTNASQASTQATFPVAGSYVLQLTASDGALQSSQQITATISAPLDQTPPSIPVSLAVTAKTSTTVSLSWGASTDTGSGMAGYKVYNGSTLVATLPASQLSYTVGALTPSTSYVLGVSAYDLASNESPQAQISAVTDPASVSWQDQDIGAVAAAGSFNQNAGTLTVTGSGADIWGTADEFHYAYQTLTGNGQIVARMAGWGTTYNWSKAGVMVREQLTANARYAYVLLAVYSTGASACVQYRSTAGGTAAQVSCDSSGVAPYWLKLVRQNDVLTAYISGDGVNWKLKGTVTLTGLASTVQIGLAVTSHKDGSLTSAQFDNVTITTN